MQEVKEQSVSTILSRIYRDTIITKTKNYFISLVYKPSQFSSLLSPSEFHSIIGFLPNTKYKGKPFIMSVIYNKKNNSYEVTVKNPNVK